MMTEDEEPFVSAYLHRYPLRDKDRPGGKVLGNRRPTSAKHCTKKAEDTKTEVIVTLHDTEPGDHYDPALWHALEPILLDEHTEDGP